MSFTYLIYNIKYLFRENVNWFFLKVRKHMKMGTPKIHCLLFPLLPPPIPFSQSIKVKYTKFFPTCPKPIISSIWDRRNMVHLFIYSFIHLTDILEGSQTGPLSTRNKTTNKIYVPSC